MQRNGTLHCYFPELEVTTSQAPTRPPPSCTPPKRPPRPSSARPAPRRTHHTPCKRIYTCRCNNQIYCWNFFETMWADPMQCAELELSSLSQHFLAVILKDDPTCPTLWLPMQSKRATKNIHKHTTFCLTLSVYQATVEILSNPWNFVIAPILYLLFPIPVITVNR